MNTPQPVLNIAEHLGLLILEWAERPDAWVIISSTGSKVVVDKTSALCDPPSAAVRAERKEARQAAQDEVDKAAGVPAVSANEKQARKRGKKS